MLTKQRARIDESWGVYVRMEFSGGVDGISNEEGAK